MRRQDTRCTPPALQEKFPQEGVGCGLGRAFHSLAHRAEIKGVGVLLAEDAGLLLDAPLPRSQTRLAGRFLDTESGAGSSRYPPSGRQTKTAFLEEFCKEHLLHDAEPGAAEEFFPCGNFADRLHLPVREHIAFEGCSNDAFPPASTGEPARHGVRSSSRKEDEFRGITIPDAEKNLIARFERIRGLVAEDRKFTHALQLQFARVGRLLAAISARFHQGQETGAAGAEMQRPKTGQILYRPFGPRLPLHEKQTDQHYPHKYRQSLHPFASQILCFPGTGQ